MSAVLAPAPGPPLRAGQPSALRGCFGSAQLRITLFSHLPRPDIIRLRCLKFFPGVSPVEELVSKTFHILTFGLIDGRAAMIVTAIPECLIGLSLLSAVS